jgi:hypothetical protein
VTLLFVIPKDPQVLRRFIFLPPSTVLPPALPWFVDGVKADDDDEADDDADDDADGCSGGFGNIYDSRGIKQSLLQVWVRIVGYLAKRRH